MHYEVVIFCHDCTGEDYDGCFDGGTETIDRDPYDESVITDLIRANNIGWDTVDNVGPWDFWVNEISDDGKIIRKITQETGRA